MSATTEAPPVEERTASIVDRNLDLFHGFTQAMLERPELLKDVPHGVHLVLLPENDPEMFEINLGIAVKAARRGETVLIRHTKRDGRPK